ncbi:MAG: hypothetical protein J0L97_07915 [Alphaproteobacteria bacterium]|nr:hypothetical protein [Alphaproteobacteria bacterium]
MAQKTSTKPILVIIVAVVVAIALYAILTMPDQRTGAQKLGDAIGELPNGVDKAARQLEDRTPGEKIGDAVKDAGDAIKDGTNR